MFCHRSYAVEDYWYRSLTPVVVFVQEMFQQEGTDPRKVDDDFEDWIKTGKRKSSTGNANGGEVCAK